MDTAFFYIFATMTLFGAVMTITRSNAIHNALWLTVSLLGVAGLYLLQKAEFLFAVQIILYIGGIMLLFLFVIMLVNLDEAAKQRQFNKQWLLALICVAGAGVEVAWFLRRGAGLLPPPVVGPAPTEGNIEMLADLLFREYLLPFELASILLLVAVVGSVIMAKKRI